MCRLSSDFLEKIVAWYTENKDLQNLMERLEAVENSDGHLAGAYRVHVAHVASVDKASRLQKCDLRVVVTILHAV